MISSQKAKFIDVPAVCYGSHAYMLMRLLVDSISFSDMQYVLTWYYRKSSFV